MVSEINRREKTSSRVSEPVLPFDAPMIAPAAETRQSSVPNLDQAFGKVLRDILHSGAAVRGGSSLSVGSNKLTRELLNYSFELASGP